MQGAGIEPGAPSATDRNLFAKARGGDLAAFEAIAVQRLPGLYRLAHAILGVDGEAAEATCNTLVGAWHEFPHLDDPARLDDWLDRILVSECRMALERTSREGVGPRPAVPPDAPDELDRDTIIRLLEGAFESLDAVDRAVLVLHDLGHRSPAAVAGTLHMPPATVKWRLHEAHLALRAALETPA
jgi:DNA-directed RNA polymerase specialized sigma24 family protein